MNYDPIDTCPYDSVHRIMRSRMQYHLTKCAKNWPHSKKKQCPYDARHIINEIEFNYHLSICEKRESVVRYKIVENEEDTQHPKFLPIDNKPALAIAEENWEDDGPVRTYDPMKHTEDRLVTRILIGAPKSQRKKHRIQERLRISRLEDAPKLEKDSVIKSNSTRQAPSPSISTIRKEVSAETEQDYKPLRRPKKLPHDISKISEISSVNDSAVMNESQDTVNESEPWQGIEEKSNTQSLDLQKTTFSYAAAAKKRVPTNQHQQKSSTESDHDVVVESIKFDIEKESKSSFSIVDPGKKSKSLLSNVNSEKESKSLLSTTIDKNLVEVTKTVESLTIGDEGHKIQSESLDKTLDSLKKKDCSKSNDLNKSRNNASSTEKGFSRCAANLRFTKR